MWTHYYDHLQLYYVYIWLCTQIKKDSLHIMWYEDQLSEVRWTIPPLLPHILMLTLCGHT